MNTQIQEKKASQIRYSTVAAREYNESDRKTSAPGVVRREYEYKIKNKTVPIKVGITIPFLYFE